MLYNVIHHPTNCLGFHDVPWSAWFVANWDWDVHPIVPVQTCSKHKPSGKVKVGSWKQREFQSSLGKVVVATKKPTPPASLPPSTKAPSCKERSTCRGDQQNPKMNHSETIKQRVIGKKMETELYKKIRKNMDISSLESLDTETRRGLGGRLKAQFTLVKNNKAVAVEGFRWRKKQPLPQGIATFYNIQICWL